MEERINKLKAQTSMIERVSNAPYKNVESVDSSSPFNRTTNTYMQGDQSVDFELNEPRNKVINNSIKQEDESDWSSMMKDPVVTNS